ncbi:MAG: glycosyltransferase family 2 protein [Chitinophagales bacterium]
MSKSLSIIIPSYNEAANLPLLIPPLMQAAKKQNWQVIFVNDGSKDNSLKILQNLQQDHDFKIIHHKVNKGYGGAIKQGIREAITDLVITIDADGQHSIEDVRKLYEYLLSENADMVVGKRPDSSSSVYRRLGKCLIRKIANILLPINIHDINSGMKIYDTKLAQQYLDLCPDSMAYSDIITLVFISYRHLVLEHPIQIHQRIAGESTISTRTAFQTILEILNITMLFNPLKIFLPIAAISILIGFIWGLPILLDKRGLSVGALFFILSGILFFLMGLLAEQLSNIRKIVGKK